jgi:hypothetical protein
MDKRVLSKQRAIVAATLVITLFSVLPNHTAAGEIRQLGKGVGSSCGTWTEVSISVE